MKALKLHTLSALLVISSASVLASEMDYEVTDPCGL